MTKLTTAASLVVMSLASLLLGGCGLVPQGLASDGRCGSAALTLSAERPAAAETTGWKLPAAIALHDAAAACGVVALPNAPATVSVRFGATGSVSAVGVDSEIFGGDEMVRCLSARIDATGVGQIGGGALSVALPAMAVGE